MRPLAILAVLAPAAAALEVLRAEGSPHDGACGAAGVRRRPPTNLHRASRVASERVGPVRARPNPACARARAAGVGQLVVHRQDGQHGSQTVRSSFSSSRRPWPARAPRLPSRARIPARADASLIRKMVVEVSPHFVDWSGAQLFRILGRPALGPPDSRGRVRVRGAHLVRPVVEAKKIAPSDAPRHLRASVDLRATRRRSARSGSGGISGGGGGSAGGARAVARECLQPGDRLGIGFAPGELGGSRWWSMCRGRKQPTTTAHMGAVASRL